MGVNKRNIKRTLRMSGKHYLDFRKPRNQKIHFMTQIESGEKLNNVVVVRVKQKKTKKGFEILEKNRNF